MHVLEYYIYVLSVCVMVFKSVSILSQGGSANTGITLWFQQFVAMLLKHFFNSIRFWMNIIWQLVIPLIFVLLSLIYAVTVANQSFGTEPSRTITVESSSFSDNRTFFFAQFGDESDLLNFEVSRK